MWKSITHGPIPGTGSRSDGERFFVGTIRAGVQPTLDPAAVVFCLLDGIACQPYVRPSVCLFVPRAMNMER